MNGRTASIAPLLKAICEGIDAMTDIEIAVFPPFPYLPFVSERLAGSTIGCGAQNVSAEAPGAFTGEVAAGMLTDFGCQYVIVGHSERRTLYGEDDHTVARKFAQAAASDLAPVLCVGETLSERESGQTHAVVERQLRAVLDQVGAAGLTRALVAYEPVWAIGTGKTATPEQAQAAHAFIRELIASYDPAAANAVRILYGGSVNPDNAASLFKMNDIDGGLIGGASLKAESFLAICRAANSP